MTVLGTNSVEHTADLLLRRAGTTRLTVTSTGITLSGSLNGFTVVGAVGNRWTNIPAIASNGVMEIGRYIDFHRTAGDTTDYTYRIDNNVNGNLAFSGNISFVTATGALSGTATNANKINRNGILSTDASNYRVLLGEANNNVGFQDCHVVTNSSRLYYQPSTNTLTCGTFSGSGSFSNITISDKIIHAGDTDTAIRFPTANTVTVETGGSERARLNSAGLTLSGYVQTNRIQNVEANDAIVLEPSDDSIRFITNNGERVRINGGGDILVGQTSTATPGVSNTTVGMAYDVSATRLSGSRASGTFLSVNRNSNGSVIELRRSGTTRGSISVTNSSTAYNTSSDYRLKENVVPLDGAITRLSQLPVHRFNFIADPGTVVDGFIAHEAAAVVPECVTGEKDEVDEDGTPIYQGIDQSKIVPLLTAALQESIAKINSLESRIAALES